MRNSSTRTDLSAAPGDAVGGDVTRGSLANACQNAVHFLAKALGEATVSLYFGMDGVGTLAASTVEDAPPTTTLPGLVAAPRNKNSIRLPLHDGESVLGVLVVESTDLRADGLEMIRSVGEVVTSAVLQERKLVELQRSEARLIEAQRISKVGSYDFEIAANTNRWSDQLYRIYGREPQSFEANYETFLSMVDPDDHAKIIATHQHSIETLEPYEMEEQIIWPDGQRRTLASWGEVVCDADGNPARMVGICWDITESKAFEEQLIRDAVHDRLTGLPNRTLFMDRATQALSARQRNGGVLAVLFIDIDRFKVINDGLGHDAGDEVLVEVARRLSRAMRPGDTVARFGGDEFIVICEGLEAHADVLSLAARLQTAVNEPLEVRSTSFVITVSIGVAFPHPDAGPEVAVDLLRDADAAMYRAKQEGRARSVVFADAMRVEAMDRLETENQLRHALTAGQLRVYYQPLVEVSTGALLGVEALVRWQHPTRGLVGPVDFIPIAEETGMVVLLGEWVLEESCRQLVSWRAEFPQLHNLSIAVNMSGLQLAVPDLAERIEDILVRTGVERSAVELEITESILMHDVDETMQVVKALKTLGIRLSIDDFGTGYSSLAYLKRYPVDTLKIDSTFVDGLGADAEDSAIVTAIQALADSLGMSTVAEGVESPLQLNELRRLGCSRAQGYLFSRPMPPEDFRLMMATGTPWSTY